MKPKKWWIKERYNPQLGTYYVAMGQLSKIRAMAHERTLYGVNTMHSFDTQKEYEDKCKEWKAK